MLIILISSSGRSLNTLVFSIRCITSNPCVALPKMVCLLSNQGYMLLNASVNIHAIYIRHLLQHTVASVVTKNCDPFVFGPALAMLNVYGLSCFRLENSSSNSRPQILSPPVPSPNGSPVCIMNFLITRWNMMLL